MTIVQLTDDQKEATIAEAALKALGIVCKTSTPLPRCEAVLVGANTRSHVHRLGGKPQAINPDHLSSSRIHRAHCSAAAMGQVRDTLVAPRRSSMRMSGAGAHAGGATCARHWR
jgi:hypothetical protein